MQQLIKAALGHPGPDEQLYCTGHNGQQQADCGSDPEVWYSQHGRTQDRHHGQHTEHHALGHAAAVGGRILLFLPLHDTLHTIGKGDLLFFQIFKRFQPDGGGQDEQQPQRDEEQQEDDTKPCHPLFAGCTIAPCAQNKQRDGAEDAQAHTRRHLPLHGLHRAEICVCLVK